MPASAAAALPPLLPEPRRARRARGTFRLRDTLPIVLGPDSDDADFQAACALRDGLRARCGVRLAVETHARHAGLGRCLALRRRRGSGQGYRLEVTSEGVEAVGEGPAGLRYAVETLIQLADARGRLPACRVEDAPDFERRGVLLDVSRGKVPTAATLRRLVDLCVQLKLNVLMLYVEHTFRFRRHPDIGAGASPLDAETLRELDAYAAARHVELVPCLQSLGHMERVLRLPRYAPLAESPAAWSLSPADPATYALLDDLYEEFLPNFRSTLFNANCDEPHDLGTGRSAERASAVGRAGVFLEHVRRVRELAAAHGKRTAIWADFVHAHPERLDEIDRDLVLLDWGYEAEHDTERVAAFAKRGLTFWVCPGTSTWNALFPRIDNALANVARWADAGRRHGAAGLLVTDWGDFGHYNLQGNSWFGYAWAAQHAWSGAPDARRFDRAFARVVFGDPSGETARVYRELGALHDAGYCVANASPLQFLYFDDLEQAVFLRGARPAALRRTAARAERARARLETARPRFARDPLTYEELRLAADASLFAARKGLAALDALDWRCGRAALDARARRRLARRLNELASEQEALRRRLVRLWLARSRRSNVDVTTRRINRSIRSLRSAARALERGRPPAPPPPHPGFAPRTVLAALRASQAGPRR